MKDQEKLRAELEKHHEEQEKRLTSMAEANMSQLKKENEEALRKLQSNMQIQASNLEQSNRNLESQISSLRAELNKPRPGMTTFCCHLLHRVLKSPEPCLYLLTKIRMQTKFMVPSINQYRLLTSRIQKFYVGSFT